MENPHRPVALVTGAGRRLGRAIAQELAAQGYDLALAAWEHHAALGLLVDELGHRGARARAFSADLSDPGVPPRLVREVVAEFGSLSLLVNNAGVIGVRGLDDLDAIDLDAAHAVNVRAPYLLSLAAHDALRGTRGSIVNIASVGGLLPYAGHPAYSMTKAALVMQTRVLARRLAPDVRVNAVAPGTLFFPGEEAGSVAKPDPAKIPLGRYGSAEHVCAAILYFAAAPWTTGSVLPVDGGASIRGAS